jgi:hypothetical protein
MVTLSARLPHALLVVAYFMVAVPGVMPVTMPVVETVAAVLTDLLHVPPADAAVKVTGAPIQTLAGAVICGSPGAVSTVMALIARTEVHALVIVYMTVSEPADTPVITPVADTVARLVLLMLQAPPVVASDMARVLPGQTVTAPPITLTVGIEPTVTSHVATAEPTV